MDKLNLQMLERAMNNEVAPQREYCLFMSENLIRSNWDLLKNDPDNPRKDIETPEEWIRLAKAGELFSGALNARIVILNRPRVFKR